MENNIEIYFHLGLPKTASTYMQRVVFPNMENIKFYKKHDYKMHKSDFETINNKVIFSCEKDQELFDEFKELKKLHPEAKIILVFREHLDWIKSKYKYYIRKNGHLSFKDFYNDKLCKNLGLHPNYYTDIVNELKKYFPDYLILTHDLLKSNPDKFIQLLHDFTGVENKGNFSNKKVKKAFTYRQLSVLRWYNSLWHFDENKYSSKKKQKRYEKFRGALLFTLAFFANLNPVDSKAIPKEFEAEKDNILNYFKKDWENINDIANKGLLKNT